MSKIGAATEQGKESGLRRALASFSRKIECVWFCESTMRLSITFIA